jgi:hypothetical protein
MAALVAPGLAPALLLRRIADARAGIRAAWDAVVTAGTIRALGAADPSARS